jgi:hypothetical protein
MGETMTAVTAEQLAEWKALADSIHIGPTPFMKLVDATPLLVAEVERLREASVEAHSVVKLAKDARRMHEIGIKRSGDVTGAEHMEYLSLERTGLTFDIARGIVDALRARTALPEESAP